MAVQEQIKALGDDDEAVREAAKKQLAAFGTTALPALTTVLKGDNKKLVRVGVAQVLEMMGPTAKGAILALNKAATDEDEDVRAAAKKALQAIDVKEPAKELAK
jgi:HEAT repeat protein